MRAASGLGRWLATCLLAGPSVAAHATPAPTTAATPPALSSAPTPADRRLFFRYNAVGADYGRLAITNADAPGKFQFAGDLRCEVAHVGATLGVCLTVEQRLLGTFAAALFDPRTFRVLGKVPVQGVPSRTRMAPGGHLAAFTVFTSGHGYASTTFATKTTLIDTATIKVLDDLEAYAVFQDGKPFKEKDFNFWGVTFTPDGRSFYATLQTGGHQYLIKGDPEHRTAAVIHDNVECPSVSPDGTRIAYKKRIPGHMIVWELHMLDIKTNTETSLAERRSIDDQIEWLDDTTILYAVAASNDAVTPSTELWRTAADGSGTPRLFLANAASPSMVR